MRFQELNGNRGSVKRVLEGIEAAALAGISVKINMVVQKARIEQDILCDGLGCIYSGQKTYACVLLQIYGCWKLSEAGWKLR